MSQENVGLIKTYFDVWNSGDMDALRQMYHPDVIVRAPRGWPEPGPFVGRDAVMGQWERMRGAFDQDVIEASDFIPIADHVVVPMTWHGAGSGPGVDMNVTGIYSVRNGKVFAQEFFWDRAEALEAVGLSEPDGHADS
jgi:ketosteroid isomerase-like protein